MIRKNEQPMINTAMLERTQTMVTLAVSVALAMVASRVQVLVALKTFSNPSLVGAAAVMQIRMHQDKVQIYSIWLI